MVGSLASGSCVAELAGSSVSAGCVVVLAGSSASFADCLVAAVVGLAATPLLGSYT